MSNLIKEQALDPASEALVAALPVDRVSHFGGALPMNLATNHTPHSIAREAACSVQPRCWRARRLASVMISANRLGRLKLI